MSNCCFVAEPPLRLTGDGTTGDCWCLDLQTVNSSCILLDQNAGALEAEIVEDPDPCNSLECRPTGLFVPPVHTGLAVLEANGDPIEAPASLINVTMDSGIPALASFETAVLETEITNPSDCRTAIWFVTVGGPSGQLLVDGTGGEDDIREELLVSIGAAPFAVVDTRRVQVGSGSGDYTWSGGEQSVPIPIILAVSATETVAIRKRYTAIAGTPTIVSSGGRRISGFLLTT